MMAWALSGPLDATMATRSWDVISVVVALGMRWNIQSHESRGSKKWPF